MNRRGFLGALAALAGASQQAPAAPVPRARARSREVELPANATGGLMFVADGQLCWRSADGTVTKVSAV